MPDSTHSTAATASEHWADFTTSLQFGDLPDEVRRSLYLRIVDVLGVGIAALAQPSTAAIRAAFADQGVGPPGGLLIGQDAHAPAATAALFNAALCHSLDFDDTHYPSVIHPSAIVVATALACGSALSTRGHELLTATAAGYEVLLRVGMAAPDGLNARSFGGTSGNGPFGAAAVASRLLALTREQTVHAFGLAGSLSAGLFQWAEEGSWTKRFQVGWSAYVGVHAAVLARAGVLAPRRIVEGRHGFLNAHVGAGNWNEAELTAGLGSRWHLTQVNTKPYPCCANLFSFIDAALALRAQHALRPDDIERIDCVVPEQQEPVICDPWELKRAPPTEPVAQFSLSYAVAVALVHGDVGLASFGTVTRADRAVLQLTARTHYTTFHDDGWPGRQYGEVRITLRDGRQLAQVEPFSTGSMQKPMSAAAIERKFSGNVATVWADARASRVLQGVAALDANAPASALADALH